MWATSPWPKKLAGRMPLVRSRSWSGITTWRGAIPSRRLPTALTDSKWVTPNVFIAQTLAREGSSLGLIRCPLPCRGKKATRTPASVPTVMVSLGFPKGVFMSNTSMSLNASMSYSPLPPMTPTLAPGIVSLLIRNSIVEQIIAATLGRTRRHTAIGSQDPGSSQPNAEPRPRVCQP